MERIDLTPEVLLKLVYVDLRVMLRHVEWLKSEKSIKSCVTIPHRVNDEIEATHNNLLDIIDRIEKRL